MLSTKRFSLSEPTKENSQDEDEDLGPDEVEAEALAPGFPLPFPYMKLRVNLERRIRGMPEAKLEEEGKRTIPTFIIITS